MFQEIFAHLAQNKLRTALTGLSVSVGIFLLIFLLGAGNGLIHATEANSGNFASDVVSVIGGYTSEAYDGLNKDRKIDLDDGDLRQTENVAKHRVDETSASIVKSGQKMISGDHLADASLHGVYPAARQMERINLLAGRFINDNDLRQRRKVAVISAQRAEEFFGGPERALEQVVNVDSLAFRIVGVRSRGGDFSPEKMQVPFTTLRLAFNMGASVGTIYLRSEQAGDEKVMNGLEHDIRHTVGRRRRFNPGDPTALWIYNRAEGAKEQATALGILRTALWIIGLLTLLSGVVSISNIMLITVKERTHEFGIRKALGARPWSILRSVLAESVIITLLSGYVGLVAGIAATEWMNRVSGQRVMTIMDQKFYTFLDPTTDLATAAGALAVLVFAGLTAGFFPARKAVLIKPIVALNSK